MDDSKCLELSAGKTCLEFDRTIPYLRSASCDPHLWNSEGPIVAWCCLEGKNERIKAAVRSNGKASLESSTRLVYPCSAVYSAQTIAKFNLAYEVCSEGFKVELFGVKHIDNYRLLEIEIPHLLITNHPEAQIIEVRAGHVFRLSTEKSLRQRWNAGNFPVPHAILFNPDALAVLEPVNTAEDIIIGIDKNSGKSIAYLGVVLRVGRGGIRFLQVQDLSSIKVNFLVRRKNRPSLRWTDGAKLIRKDVPNMLNDMYIDGMVYKIFCDDPTQHKPKNKGKRNKNIFDFNKLREFFRLANRLTDGTPQIAYLVGWQNEGHDSKYPYIEKVNPRLGTYEQLSELFEIAKQNNITLSFHDNYDDVYLDSPAWDEKIVTINSNGNLMKGGVWSGGQSYLVGHAKYVASGKAVKRIERTLSLYPIRKSYHLDVLSITTRDDFDPDHPAGSPSNMEAKRQIVREFDRRGVDITSEAVTWFFRDVQHHSYHLWTRGRLLDESLPILSFIFHGKMTYGSFNPVHREGQSEAEIEAISILQGGIWDDDLSMADVSAQLCKAFYKCWVPFHVLARREMQDYLDQPHPKVIYDNDSYVELPTPKTYRVVVDGMEIANERYSIYHKSKDCLLVWSERGCELFLEDLLPNIKTVSVLNLATDEKFDHNVNQRLLLNPGQPAKIESKL